MKAFENYKLKAAENMECICKRAQCIARLALIQVICMVSFS